MHEQNVMLAIDISWHTENMNGGIAMLETILHISEYIHPMVQFFCITIIQGIIAFFGSNLVLTLTGPLLALLVVTVSIVMLSLSAFQVLIVIVGAERFKS